MGPTGEFSKFPREILHLVKISKLSHLGHILESKVLFASTNDYSQSRGKTGC